LLDQQIMPTRPENQMVFRLYRKVTIQEWKIDKTEGKSITLGIDPGGRLSIDPGRPRLGIDPGGPRLGIDPGGPRLGGQLGII
jgi:hypothetical protein